MSSAPSAWTLNQVQNNQVLSDPSSQLRGQLSEEAFPKQLCDFCFYPWQPGWGLTRDGELTNTLGSGRLAPLLQFWERTVFVDSDTGLNLSVVYTFSMCVFLSWHFIKLIEDRACIAQAGFELATQSRITCSRLCLWRATVTGMCHHA